MSNQERSIEQTQHAFLVVWGRFAKQMGLLAEIKAVKLSQKKYHYEPQTKVVEFLVATLAGLKPLQEISLAAHPLDRDQTVAMAWEQIGWADYSGVSRTLSGLSWAEVERLVQALEQVSQPFIQAELARLQGQKARIQLDGDLTGIPVSNTSRTYPNAAFGHMDDEIRLGYQAGVVSLVSPTYGRLWLLIAHHPGDTVSCTQAEALVLAAEARTSLRPWRRTDLLQQRLQSCQASLVKTQQGLQRHQVEVVEAQIRLIEAEQQERSRHQALTDLEQADQIRPHPERPTGRLAQARQRWQAAQKRSRSREKAWQQAQKKQGNTQARLVQQQTELACLQTRLTRFEQDNQTNPTPVALEFRLDAGFGTYENLALLIEMGYDLYTKPHNYKVVGYLKNQIDPSSLWTRVGDNAEMMAWPNYQLSRCPYPLNVALERFYTGKTLKYSALVHFGADKVTQDLPAWFHHYNGRQIIEAGIKESKQVFQLHRIKVRSEPAIYLQEAFVIFAANFIRWAAHWLSHQDLSAQNSLTVRTLGVKRQVQVAAHVSAQVIREPDSWLLMFSQQIAFAGKILRLPNGDYSPFSILKS
jgi:hypothetical protein